MVAKYRQRLTLSGSLVAVALVLLAGNRLMGRNALAAPPATFDVTDCDVIVTPGESLQAAVTAAANGQTLCVRGGVYIEMLTVRADQSGLTLIAYPGETPIIDGDKRLPGGGAGDRFDSLVSILGSDITLDGFVIRHSSSRAMDVNGDNAVVRNTTVQDNWGGGIVVAGKGDDFVSGVLIENNQVNDNLRKARHIPVIYRGMRVAEGPTGWEFNPDEMWDAPFWSGADTDLPEAWLSGISMTFNDDGRTSRIYAGSARSGRVGYIGPDYSATGQQFIYSGADILFHDPATNLWTLYFNGDALNSQGPLNARAMIDAFQIDSAAAPPECPACAPLFMSFAATATVTISGTATAIGPSDLVRFQPAATDAYGRISAGDFTLFRRAADMGLPAAANIDALDRTPDGRFLASFTGRVELGGATFDNEDLAAYNELDGSWSLYFDGDQIPFNPFQSALTAAWLDRQGNIYISGDPVGGSGLVFVEAEDSVARGNVIYHNYGEGLVAGRYTTRITLEDNVTYDNEHANLYLNATAYPLVQRNLIFCTDDREFWRKGSVPDYRPGPGLQLRDEDFEGQAEMPPASIGQVIINNLVIGCSTNFGVATQRAAGQGGLRDALVANNIFANARGDNAAQVTNVEFGANATYDNSRFVNNLIVQSPPGTIARVVGTRAGAFATLTLANNLYSAAPSDGWPAGESDPIIADPAFANGAPPLPAAGAVPDAGDYRIDYASPAFDAGLELAEVSADYFGQSRTASGLSDIGVHELPHIGVIVVALETGPARFTQSFDFTASFAPNAFALTGGQNRASGALEAGVYSVAAADVAGWTTSAACSDGSPASAIDLGPTETVICTFSSARLTQLTVSNALDPAGDPQLVDFSLSPGEPFQLGHDSRTFTVAPGEMALAAVAPEGWAQTAAVCDNGDAPGALTLAAGDWVMCSFSHRKLGRVVVEKQTLPDGAAQAFTFSAGYDGDGFALEDGQRDTSPYLVPGTYAVAETVPDGWVQTSATCNDGSTPAAIDLAAGETVTCVFVNARLALDASLNATPSAVTAPGGDVSFAVQITNRGGAAVELTALTDSVYGNVAGAPSGALKSTTCSLPQTLQSDASYACAYTATVSGTGGTTQTNTLTGDATGVGGAPISETAEATVAIETAPPGRIIVVKQTDPANSPGSFPFTASYAPGGFSLGHGQSHDSGPLPSGTTYSVFETPPAGWTLASAVCAGDDDGNDPAAIFLDPNETVTCTFTNRRTTTGPAATFYVAASTAGTVRGLAYVAGDILAYNGLTDAWSLYFDGSDVGWTRAIGDFERLPDGSLLLTSSGRVTLGAGAGKFTLEGQDIARFVPTGLGETTAGAFSLYFDGSDVTLSTSSERIDALAVKDDGTLLISTTGRATVKNGATAVIGQDEDLLAFRPSRTGATTAGTWALLPGGFDGSALAGMAAEDVTGAWYDGSTGDLYLTITNAFTVGGIAGNQKIVLKVTPAGAVSEYWNAGAGGFPGGLDALFIAP